MTPCRPGSMVVVVLWTCVGCIRSNGCPAFWTRVDSHCYRLVSSLGVDSLGFPTIHHARATCKQYGGDLAYIKNMTTENEIFAIIRNIAKDSMPRKIYIGLSDMQSPSNFTWLAAGEPLDYTDWAPGEPGSRPDEHCVVVKSPYMTWLSPEETEWHDYPCCQQANIKHAMCSRASGLYDDDITDVTDIFQTVCNTVNECDSNPCQNGGSCRDLMMGYTCDCSYHYRGSHCQREVLCPLPNLENATLGTVEEMVPGDLGLDLGLEQGLESVLTITCQQGLGFAERTLPPAKKYNCTPDGWQEIVEKEIVCSPFPVWEGYIVNSTLRRYYYGDSMDYMCSEGQHFGDNDNETMKSSMCNITGNWDPPIVECQELVTLVAELRYKKPVEAKGAALVGTFGLAFLVAEISLFVLIDINSLRQQFLVGYHNLKTVCKKRPGTHQPVPVHL